MNYIWIIIWNLYNIIIQISKGTSNIFLFHLYLKNIFHSETEKLLSRTRRQFLKSFLNSFNDIYNYILIMNIDIYIKISFHLLSQSIPLIYSQKIFKYRNIQNPLEKHRCTINSIVKITRRSTIFQIFPSSSFNKITRSFRR